MVKVSIASATLEVAEDSEILCRSCRAAAHEDGPYCEPCRQYWEEDAPAMSATCDDLWWADD
jgi:hypothetical protein